MDRSLRIDGAADRHPASIARRISATVSPAAVVPSIDLVLAFEADEIAVLVMRAEAAAGAERAELRGEIERRATSFGDLFDQWRNEAGFEEGGTWVGSIGGAPDMREPAAQAKLRRVFR
jgi:hypothetical protein